jgi:hypothetical protein
VDTKGRSISGGVKESAGLDERGWQLLQARKPKIVDGKTKFNQSKTEAVAEKIFKLGEHQTWRATSNQIGKRMCSVQLLGPKSMDAASEACPLN